MISGNQLFDYTTKAANRELGNTEGTQVPSMKLIQPTTSQLKESDENIFLNVHKNKKKKFHRAKLHNYDDGLVVVQNLNAPEFKNQKNLNDSIDDLFEGKRKSGQDIKS